jgi:hypothetical protein
MTQEDYSKVPPPHLLKKFSEQARVDSQKRGHPGYCKTFAKLCIDWAFQEAAMDDLRDVSAEVSGVELNSQAEDWVKRAGKESRAKIALEIFRAFDISACERGTCDGPVLAAAFKEAINQLQESPGIISCSRLLYIAEALEEIDHTP